MLLCLDKPEQAQLLVLANLDDIANCFYESLLKLAKRFEQQECWLAVTVCYRSLLWDILNKVRSKAYSYAARYYKKLAIISGYIEHYAHWRIMRSL